MIQYTKNFKRTSHQMKKTGTIGLAFTFAGCFLGAGYLSGKELWQYFGSYGLFGIVGLIFALAIQLVFGILLLRLSEMTGSSRLDELIIRWKNPFLREIAGGVSLFFMFGIFVIMSAGAGSLLNRVTGLSSTIACALFCAIVALLACTGVGGMIKVFSFIVPILAAVCVATGVIQLFSGSSMHIDSTSQNPLLGGWPSSAINYAAYNLFGTIGILAPLAARLKNRKTTVFGVAAGSVLLLVIALAIILAMFTSPKTGDFDLPMLELSLGLSSILGMSYAVLLFFGMLGTSVSSLVACTEYLGARSPLLKNRRIIVTFVLGIAAFSGSLAGFGQLVSIVYPICGYLGIAALALITEHYIHIKRASKKTDV